MRQRTGLAIIDLRHQPFIIQITRVEFTAGWVEGKLRCSQAGGFALTARGVDTGRVRNTEDPGKARVRPSRY